VRDAGALCIIRVALAAVGYGKRSRRSLAGVVAAGDWGGGGVGCFANFGDDEMVDGADEGEGAADGVSDLRV